MSNNIEIAHEYFHAVQTGDMATVGGLLARDIVWHQPGSHRFSGDHQGLDAVSTLFGGMMEACDGSFAIDTVHAVMGNGDLVAVSIRFSGRREDTLMAMDGTDLMHIVDGAITKMWLFSSDQPAEEAFWETDESYQDRS